MTDLRATYRLQLSPDLDFGAVKALAPYLRDLGVSHLYLSPSLKAREGSTHGYDVVDPTQVSDVLGGEAGLRALADEADLGLILDIVPNHMGTGDENRWWADEEERKRVFDLDPEDPSFYRRFFDIDDLAAVRQEDEDVFELTHRKTLELIADGVVDGVRADHPDGLADPAGYTRRLREHGAKHVWLEKILHPGEPLRDWPVDGTVGYEFLNDAEALFVDTDAEQQFTDLWTELTGDARDFAQHARDGQLELATTTFQRELDWLVRLSDGRFDAETLAAALADVPIYRTYVEPWSGHVDPADREAVAALPEDLRRVLTLDERGLDAFVTRFQQTCPPVTAKGIEDTAFYRYNRLLALNEVGGDPGRFGIDVQTFHAGNAERAARFPRNLLVSTTHDTKRSADVRARIGALTRPALRDDWASLARDWVPRAPDATSGFLVLQTLIGAHPIEPIERLDGFLEKALREAKQATNWVDQDEAYESSVKQYARDLLADDAFRAAFDPLCERAVIAGRHSALGQLALKLTSPGIPDVYGGDELEYLALVDPDNRRPVDFDARRTALGKAGDATNPKLDLIHAVLGLRKRHQAVFETGAYTPVEAGPDVVAFTRGDADVLVVVPTHEAATGRLGTSLPGEYRELLTGTRVEIREGMELGGHGPAVYERI